MLELDANENLNKQMTLMSGLNSPNGVAIHNGYLYVQEISQLRRYKWQDLVTAFNSNITITIASSQLLYEYPTDTHHGWKFIRVGPDG